jgi:hypothetical protein
MGDGMLAVACPPSSGVSIDFIDPVAWGTVERLSCARYVECRLLPGQPDLDYLLAFSRSRAEALETALVHALAEAPVSQRQRWKPLLSLLGAWRDGSSRTSRQVPAIWLEFDAVNRSGRRGVSPSVSVCMTPDYRAEQEIFANSQSQELSVIDEVLALLGVQSVGQRLVAECFRCLPPGSRWIHFSTMIGRDSRALKLYGVLPRCELMPYLDAIGWGGDRSTVSYLLQELYPGEVLGDLVFIDVNLSNLRDSRTASLGLAVSQQHLVRGADKDPLRRGVLDRWCESGLACAERIAAIQNVLSDPASCSLRDGRFLDLKLVWSADAGLVAKGYLGFHYQPAALPWA